MKDYKTVIKVRVDLKAHILSPTLPKVGSNVVAYYEPMYRFNDPVEGTVLEILETEIPKDGHELAHSVANMAATLQDEVATVIQEIELGGDHDGSRMQKLLELMQEVKESVENIHTAVTDFWWEA